MSNAREFRPDIQGLRAIAVLLVVLYHSGLPLLTGGYVGVDVFFVVSGFLITGHIYASLQRSEFRFASFYARRVRRILPASLVVLVLTLVVAKLVVPPLEFARVARDAAWTAVYLPNILFAREGTDYLASSQPSLYQHYWSLGIEEQFYLLWPLILWGVYRLSRRNLKIVTSVVAVLVAASFAGSVLLTPENQPYAFFLLPTRAWELGVGGLTAVLLARRPMALSRVARSTIAWLGLSLLAVSAFAFDSATPFPSYFAALPVLGTAAVILAGPYDGLLGRVLQNRIALWVGAISYSVYLVHWPMLIIPEAAHYWSAPLPLWLSLLIGMAALPVGWLSYRFIETPFRRPRGRSSAKPSGWRTTWIPLTAAIAAAVVVASVSVYGMRSVATMQLNAGKPAPAFELSTAPQSADFIGSNLSVRLQDAQKEKAVPTGKGCMLTVYSSPEPASCTYGEDQSALSVALVGDSHAAQWFPALDELADQGEIYLTANTKSGCTLFERDVSGPANETADCVEWKQRVVDILAADPPDVILIGNSIRYSQPEEFDRGMRKLLERLPQSSEVLLLQDTPNFPGEAMDCLSANLLSPERCAVAREIGIESDFAARLDTLVEEFDATELDLNDYLCAEMCPPVQGDVLVFKDSQHLSKTFARAMAPVFSERLAAAVSN